MSTDTDKFVTPCALPEGYERELLTKLAEESSEVIQRVCKALVFGLDETQPEQEFTNAQRIGLEVGDFLAVLFRLKEAGVIDELSIEAGMANKRRQLDKYLQFAPKVKP